MDGIVLAAKILAAAILVSRDWTVESAVRVVEQTERKLINGEEKTNG